MHPLNLLLIQILFLPDCLCAMCLSLRCSVLCLPVLILIILVLLSAFFGFCLLSPTFCTWFSCLDFSIFVFSCKDSIYVYICLLSRALESLFWVPWMSDLATRDPAVWSSEYKELLAQPDTSSPWAETHLSVRTRKTHDLSIWHDWF